MRSETPDSERIGPPASKPEEYHGNVRSETAKSLPGSKTEPLATANLQQLISNVIGNQKLVIGCCVNGVSLELHSNVRPR